MEINVLEWLENTAARCPDKHAFTDTKTSVSFVQLMHNAQAIGSALAEHTEPRKGVAVISGRHILTPAAFLGIVYSGCFYAPVDASMPQARIMKMLSTLSPDIILVDRKNYDFAQSLNFSAKILVIEDLLEHEVNHDALKNIRRFANENDPLYVIFTSGSTGNPKGVITSHHSLMCYIDAYSEVLGIEENDTFGNQSPLDYIAAVRDIYLPLRHGASTVIIPKELFMTPGLLFDFMNEHKITSVGWSVSALTVPASLGAFDHAVPATLKKVCFSGSVMPCKCLKTWQQHLPDTLFVNQYGPTEATASCTYYKIHGIVDDDTVLPIGLPYRDYRVFLLNEDGSATPNGEKGEICVSGPILALGYYNDKVRTDAAFMQNPLNKAYDERIYKTGDIGRVRDDGMLEFFGRKDRQIKHMGHRVELSEIEEAAAKSDGISECCVVYNKEKETIFMFYTGTAQVRTIALDLRKILPGFMVPRKIICLEDMPRLSNGKTDMVTLFEKTKVK